MAPVLPGLAVGGTSVKGMAGGFLQAILAEMIANKIGGALQGGLGSGLQPQITGGGGAGSKFMITLPEARQTELAFANENFRRRLMGLPELNAQEFIAEREEQLRQSAREAGQREYAREQLKTSAAIAPSVANMAGTMATANAQVGSNIAQKLLEQTIADPAMVAAATGK